MKRIITILLLSAIFSVNLPADNPDYPARLEVEGVIQTWAWANTQNRLAMVVNKGPASEITIIETAPLNRSIQIEVPIYMTIRDIEWSADDSGLILLVDKSVEYKEGVAFFDFQSLSYIQNYNFNYIRFSSADQQWAIAYNPESRCWATLASGEGHPDINISRDGNRLLSTDVYPEKADLIGWQNGRLFFTSSHPLKLQEPESGGIPEIILSNTAPGSNNESHEHKIYSVNIEEMSLTLEDSVFAPDITNSSKLNGLYYFQFKILETEAKTEILMW